MNPSRIGFMAASGIQFFQISRTLAAGYWQLSPILVLGLASLVFVIGHSISRFDTLAVGFLLHALLGIWLSLFPTTLPLLLLGAFVFAQGLCFQTWQNSPHYCFPIALIILFSIITFGHTWVPLAITCSLFFLWSFFNRFLDQML